MTLRHFCLSRTLRLLFALTFFLVTVTAARGQSASLTPRSRFFDPVIVGSSSAPLTVTLRNTSTTVPLAVSSIVTTGDFVQSNNCGSSLPVAGSCTISVIFSPTAAGERTGTLRVTDNATPATQTTNLEGDGVWPVNVTPASRSFGSVAVGTTSTARTFTVRNNSGVVQAVGITLSSTEFSQTNNCGASLAVGASCIINAVFTPTSTGQKTASIGVTYSGLGSPQSLSLTGTGIAPVTVSPASRAFGQVAMGATSAAKTFTVKNNATTPFALAIAASANFAQTNNCGASLAGGASCTVNATFAPTTTGALTGAMTVSYAGFGSPQSGSMTGTGIAPVAVTPATLAFSTTQRVGIATAARSITVKNNLPTVLPLSIAIAGDYSQTNNCGAQLAAAATCTVSVVFTPTLAGSRPGTVTITDPAPGSPRLVNLTGAGVITNLRSVAITPANSTVALGRQQQLRAIGTYGNGTTGDLTASSVWSSSNAGVASVGSNTGLASGLATGSATITAAVTGTTVRGTTNFTVAGAALVSIAVTPASASIAPLGSQQFTATGTYSDGSTAVMSPPLVAFASSNPGAATIDASGLASAITGGVTNVTASATGVPTSPAAVLTVTGPTLQSIAVAPNNPSIPKGLQQQFTAIGQYQDNSQQDLTAQVAWSSSSPAITISNAPGTQGLATAIAQGSGNITASWAGAISGVSPVTAAPPALTSIAVTPDGVSLGLHATQQYTASGTYSDASTQDLTGTATWTSGNPALVSVSNTGLAQVLAATNQATAITASSGGITSPPVWLSALSTLPISCPTPTIDMKLLVVTSGKTEADYGAIAQVLDYVGTPYTVFDMALPENAGGITPEMLSDGDCHGYYQGVIFTFGGYIYSLPGMPTLTSYEQTFKIRQVNWYMYGLPDFGFNTYTGTLDDSQTHTVNFTPAGAAVFSYANSNTPITISNAFMYLQTPLSGASVPPGASVSPLLTDASGNALSLIYDFGDGRQYLTQTFDSNQYLMHNLVLAYGLVNWVTKGIFLGDYHVYASAQVDDFFINDSEWIPGTPCTNPITHDRTPPDDSSLPTFRLNAADMTALVAWQDAKQADPSGLFSTFTLDLALNAIGTIGDNEWTGLPVPGVENDDLISEVQNYQAKFRWLHHTYDHPETLNGMTQAQIHDEVSLGNTAATTLGLTNFNSANIVTPGVTGLNDPNVPGYLVAEGIRYAVTDTSVIGQPNNGPNPSPNVGIPNSFAPELYAVPRYPNNIYFNAANPDDDQAEFQCIYNNPVQPPFNAFTWPDILDFTSSSFVVNMLKGDMNPQMFHQPNLHDYDGLGHSLISDTYDQTFSKYKALYTLPVINLSLDQLGERMKARDAYNKSGVTASLIDVGGAAPMISISVPAGAPVPSAVIPITGLNSNVAEVYGGTPISHIEMNSGQTVTLPVQ